MMSKLTVSSVDSYQLSSQLEAIGENMESDPTESIVDQLVEFSKSIGLSIVKSEIMRHLNSLNQKKY
jgi:hypothetical protein